LVPAGDVNGDGYADLICHKRTGHIHVALNDKHGGFTCVSNPAKGIGYRWCKGYKQYVFVADFDGDKRVDLMCHSYQTGVKDVRLRQVFRFLMHVRGVFESLFSCWSDTRTTIRTLRTNPRTVTWHRSQTRFSRLTFSRVGWGTPRTKMADNSDRITIFVRKYTFCWMASIILIWEI
jgi:hypothetical protein